MDTFAAATANIARRALVVVDSCNPKSVKTFWIIIGIESAVLALIFIIGILAMCVNCRVRSKLATRTPRTLTDLERGLQARREGASSTTEVAQPGNHPLANENVADNEQSERRRLTNISIVGSIIRFFGTGSCVS